MDDVWRTLSRRTQERIGSPLPERPDTADPQFLRLLSELRRVDALLAEEVINAFTGTDQRLPSEQDAETERRRQRVRTRLFMRFFRPDGLRTGRVRLHFRRTLHWAGALIAIVIVAWSAIPKSPSVSSSREPVHATASGPVPTPVAAPAPNQDRASGPGLSMRPPNRPQAPSPPVPIPLPVMPPGTSVPVAWDAPIGTAIPGATMPVESARSHVVVYEVGATVADASPIVYERNQAGQPPGGATSVIVYDAQAGQTPGFSPQSATPGGTPGDLSAQAATRGQLLEAALVTPVAVSSAGGPSPVLAEIRAGQLQGAVLFGQAVRAPDGLVGIQFTTLITKDGQQQPFKGVAYDAAAGRMGVAGQVSTMMPGAASALVAATMQAASDYFRARAQQQQVTVTNGFLTITQGALTFWDSLAATIAKAFTPATSSTTGPTVVTRLERGQIIRVIVM